MPLLIIIGVFIAWLLFRNKGRAIVGPGGVGGATPQAPSTDSAPLSAYNAGPSGLDLISQAIYQYEGAQPGDVNFDNMNPGNLRSAPGQTGSNRGYATFGSFTDGWQALQNYIASHANAHPGWDFYDFFQNYLGQTQGGPAITDQGNSDAYAEYVAQYLQVAPTMPVSAFLQGGS